MSFIFNQILYRPLFNLLVFIYTTLSFHDFGLAIVMLTVLIRLLVSPLSIKALVSQRQLQKLQPQLKAIQEKHKDDKQALSQASMALYAEHKVNPFSGCVPLLIQIPILIALYRALNGAFHPESLQSLYSFVTNPGMIKTVALGFIDLTRKNPFLAVLAGGLQFIQAWLSTRNQSAVMDATAAAMNKQLLYFFPVMVIIISWNLSTGIVIYWVTTTLFSICEQLYIKRFHVNRTTWYNSDCQLGSGASW